MTGVGVPFGGVEGPALDVAGRWPLVGRDELLRAAVAARESDGLSGVVLAGPPGAGKTRMAEEVLADAGRAGWATAWVGATASASGIPLGAFAPLLPLLSAAADRFQLLAAATKVLREGVKDGQLMIVIDDAQWLDETSATLVHQLARPERAFVVATIRTGVSVPDAVSALWAAGRVERIDVPPLTDDAVAELLGRVLGGDVEGATARRLAAATEGNALYLRELIRDGLDSSVLARRGRRWSWDGPLLPGNRLPELVELRIGNLDSPEREVVEVLAIAEPIPAALVGQLVPDGALESAERAGLVRTSLEDRRLLARLAHPLFGEVARLQMSGLRARALRCRMADAVERTGARRASDLLRLATWRLDGQGKADPQLLARAADAAERAADHELAERLGQAAIDGVDERSISFQALYALGRALYWQDKGSVADNVLARAEQAAIGDWARAQAAITRSSAKFWSRDDAAGAEAVIAEAARFVTEQGQRNQLLAHRASLRLFAGHADAALAEARAVLEARAVQDAPHVGDGDTNAELRALLVTVPALAVLGRADESKVDFDRALALALRPDTTLEFAAGQLVVARCLGLVWTGQLEEAQTLGAAADRVARADGSAEALDVLGVVLGLVALSQGRLEHAAEGLEEAAARLAKRDTGRFCGWAYTLLAQTRAQRGEEAAARSALLAAKDRRSTAVQVFDPDLLLADAWVAAACGELENAAALAAAAADTARRLGQSAHELVALHDLVRLGKPGAAAPRLAALAPKVDGRLGGLRATHAAGLVASDARAIADAATGFEELGARLLAAEAWADTSALHRRSGDLATANSTAARAAFLAEGCEGAHTPALARRGPAATLTAREWEVAALAATGLPSREIAARLVVSVRTVNNHLAHAYVKLGVSDRRKLALLLGNEQPIAHDMHWPAGARWRQCLRANAGGIHDYRRDEADGIRRAGSRRPRISAYGHTRQHRRSAGPVQSHGRGRTGDGGRTGRGNLHHRAVCGRMAGRTGGIGVYRLGG